MDNDFEDVDTGTDDDDAATQALQRQALYRMAMAQNLMNQGGQGSQMQMIPQNAGAPAQVVRQPYAGAADMLRQLSGAYMMKNAMNQLAPNARPPGKGGLFFGQGGGAAAPGDED